MNPPPKIPTKVSHELYEGGREEEKEEEGEGEETLRVRGALWSSVKGQRLRRERNVTWVPWPIVAPIVAQTALQPEVAATSLPWLVTQCLAAWHRRNTMQQQQHHPADTDVRCRPPRRRCSVRRVTTLRRYDRRKGGWKGEGERRRYTSHQCYAVRNVFRACMSVRGN